MNLEDKTVLLTGASGGIGRAIALELLNRKARVVCVDLKEDALRALADSPGVDRSSLRTVRADVTCEDEIGNLVACTVKDWGSIDVLINNAGRLRGIGALWEVDLQSWWKDLEVCLLGSAVCAQAVLPQMMKQDSGVLVNMVGGGFRSPNPGASGYGCAKTALARLSDTLAAEIGDRWNIQVYGFAPGLVRSGITEWMSEPERVEPWFGYVKESLELGRDNSAEGVAQAMCDLLRISQPALSGRIFIYDDDFEEVARRAEEIRGKDLRQTRFFTE